MGKAVVIEGKCEPLDDVDIQPLSYYEALRVQDIEHGWPEHSNSHLSRAIGYLIDRNVALPKKYWEALRSACDAIGSSMLPEFDPERVLPMCSACGAPMLRRVPTVKCALNDAELWNRLAQIYTRATDLIRAMRGTPLLYARHVGDRERLVRHLRKDYFLSQETRDYIADILEGKILRAPNRHKREKIEWRNRALTWFILEAREGGMGDDASIEHAVEVGKDKLGRRSIQKIFSEYRDVEAALLEDTRELLRQLQELQKDMKG